MYSYKKKDSFSDKLPLIGKILLRVAISLIVAIVLSLIIKTFLIFTYKMQDSSMNPTYSKNDTIWFTYLIGNLEYDNIVIIKLDNSNQVFVGRIMGKPGDRISINKKKFYRNNNEVKNAFIYFEDNRPPFPAILSNRDFFQEMKINSNHYFVLCDNRDRCMDSREYGPIKIENIIAKKF